MSRILNECSDTGALLFLASCVILCCSVLMVLGYRWKTIKTFDRLNRMIDRVMDGSFEESVFDESKLSALESKFANYMLASKLSARSIAQERNKIRELITDISHQTKTPLSNIILYSELLMENSREDGERRDIEALYRQAQKLSFLIASLVKLSRLETGIIAVSPARGSAVDLVEQLYQQYRPAAQQKQLQFYVIHTGERNDYEAKYDEKWTLEAVGNIIDNAIKYTERGSVTITLVSYELFCCIEVADTGIGISEDETAKIFRRFYRSQASSQISGIGVGLYLAREIIAAENGYIKTASRVGEGTKFCVYLPK